jgi:uncharacterized protein YjbJ (UPF0337 family)
MKSLSWILAGVGAGLAAYVILNRPAPKYATGSDVLDAAARKTADWGSTNRISGVGQSLVGSVEEKFGRATGDPDLADDGLLDKFAGSVKDAAGAGAQAVGETIHDLNR